MVRVLYYNNTVTCVVAYYNERSDKKIDRTVLTFNCITLMWLQINVFNRLMFACNII